MNEEKPNKPGRFELAAKLLLVIVFIFLLVGLLLPSTNHPRNKARIKMTEIDMKNLMSAISSYETAYGHLPIAEFGTNLDVTLGISSTDISGFQKIPATRLIASNSDLMIILMDIDWGVNAGHKMNPQKTIFIDQRRVNDTKSPGVSIVDYQYRDPWGNPYIISLDSNGDNRVRDVCYANTNVSSSALSEVGLNGLIKTNGAYELNGRVMIWSRGSDGKASADDKANAGVNKDNVLGWQ